MCRPGCLSGIPSPKGLRTMLGVSVNFRRRTNLEGADGRTCLEICFHSEPSHHHTLFSKVDHILQLILGLSPRTSLFSSDLTRQKIMGAALPPQNSSAEATSRRGGSPIRRSNAVAHRASHFGKFARKETNVSSRVKHHEATSLFPCTSTAGRDCHCDTHCAFLDLFIFDLAVR